MHAKPRESSWSLSFPLLVWKSDVVYQCSSVFVLDHLFKNESAFIQAVPSDIDYRASGSSFRCTRLSLFARSKDYQHQINLSGIEDY